MFGKKNTCTPCTLTVEALPDNTFPEDPIEDGLLIPMEEYKDLVRKEIALDLIMDCAADPKICDNFKYTWDKVLTALGPIVRRCEQQSDPEPEEDGEADA